MQRSVAALFTNWFLVLPTALSSLMSAIVIGSLANASLEPEKLAIWLALLLPPILLASLIAYAVVVVASAGTPSKAGPSLPAAIVAVARKLAGLIALSLLVASAFILVFYGLTFLVVWPIALHNLPLPSPVVWLVFILPYLGVIVLAFAMMYVVPAVVLGGKNPVTAVASSCALVARNAPASLMAFCAILLVVLGAERITHAALAVPFLSYAAAFFVGGCAAAFAAAVPARFFVLLSAQKRGEI